MTCLQSWCPVPCSTDNPAALSGSERPDHGNDDACYDDRYDEEDYDDDGIRYDDDKFHCQF